MSRLCIYTHITVLVRIFQSYKTNKRGFVIIEAEVCDNMLSVSWRMRETGGMILSESKDLRTKGLLV